MKDFYVADIPMEGVTLDDLAVAFAEAEERIRQAQSEEEIAFILRATCLRLRVQTLDDFINKKMKSEAVETKPDEIPVTVVNTEPESGPDTITTYYKSDSVPNSSSLSNTPTPTPTPSGTAIPRPAEVPPEFRASRADAKPYPGDIIYLNLDGHWRPYRVMANVDGATRLLGLFSIGDINEKEPQYLGSLSNQYCDDWCSDIVKRGQNIENHLKLSKMGTAKYYVHIPDWKELRADCEAITSDLTSAWYNDDDLSNIQVYTGRTGMTSILCGEDGELHEFPYGEVADDCMNCFPVEVHPSFTLRLGSLPYYYHRVDRAVLEEFS